MNSIKLEILKSSQLEHFKAEKDLSFTLPLDHPKRIKIREELNNIVKQINEIK